MTDAAFLAAVEADPSDAAAKLAYADWLRERGDDDLAYAWEWMARRGRWPDVVREVAVEAVLARIYPGSGPQRVFTAAWRRLPTNTRRHDGDPARLPAPVFAALPGRGGRAEGSWAAAVRGGAVALAAALRALRDAADLRRPS